MAATDAAKLSVSGQAFAALLDCCGAALGDCDGLLFGRAARPPAPPPSFIDDDDAPTSSAPNPIHLHHRPQLASPTLLPLRRPRSLPALLPRPPGHRRLLLLPPQRDAPPLHARGGRRPLALQISALTRPLVFLILAPSASSNFSVHSSDYRAFLLVERLLVPASLQVVNVGPGFWGQYHTFAAESPMPWMPRPPASGYGLGVGEEKAMDGMTEGFGPGRLHTMLTSATGHATEVEEVEELYARMIRKLEVLAREVEDTSRRARRQEAKNLLVRKNIAGLK